MQVDSEFQKDREAMKSELGRLNQRISELVEQSENLEKIKEKLSEDLIRAKGEIQVSRDKYSTLEKDYAYKMNDLDQKHQVEFVSSDLFN